MEKYRIDLVVIGSHTETIDNTDIRLSEQELTEYMDDWFECDLSCDSDTCEYNCGREKCIMELVDNETDEIICMAY